MAKRSDALQIAVLGLLHEAPLHGYELRTRLDVVIGALRRRISFGSLYPALRDLQLHGWIEQVAGPAVPVLASRRTKVVYAITASGEERLAELLAVSGPPSWEDEQFDVQFAFFARTRPEVRLRVLEGRRTRVQERLERARATGARAARRDGYLTELQRHAQESVERELAWLDGVIDRERAGRPLTGPPGAAPPGEAPSGTPAGRPLPEP